MMEPRGNYVIVGVFVFVLGAIAVGMVLWLGKSDYRGVYDQYHAYMRQSVSGLSVDSTVKYRGVNVGRVKEIALNPDNAEEVRLTLDILRGTPIKTDTVATLETQGLTGLATMNLEGGSREAPRLEPEPGQEYPVIQTKPSLFFRLDMAISRLLSEQGLSKLLSSLHGLSENTAAFMNEENRVKMEGILNDLARVSHTLSRQQEAIVLGIDRATEAAENLAILTSTVNQDMPRLVARIHQSVTAVKTVAEELARTGKTVESIVEETQPEIQQFTRQTLGETGLLVIELRQLTNTLQRVAHQIEQEPDSLIYGRPSQPRGPGE
ncbi:MlaD family protein [Candidatus Nitrospira allomarina]|uniref:MlaD family protein n=1 Tax=Candidatus Nitrospira allomarina TaxID=3020900 RepID=A0AA96GGX8_9BACT|nr:MlaD family protein [Candidatus Nitrospira allomarina]WNM60070.1 MlaD family protein [Candidatus Nitrospira allomarina]